MNKKCFQMLNLFVLFFSVAFYGHGEEKPKLNDPFIVVLDAGHGGHDPGNLGNGYLEKTIALNIVLRVGAILEKNPNIKVIYTRKDDSFVDLYKRGEIANKANANLFVSVHCDSHTSDANGAGTFVLGLHANKQNFEIAKKENSAIYLEDNYEARYAAYNINSPESVIGMTIMQEEFLDQSILLAKLMQDNFTGKLSRKDRKVKQAGFIVLHQTFMPSVLVETGFLTYKPEGAYLDSAAGQQQMGEAIASAILAYKSQITNTTTASIPPTAQEIVEKETPAVVVAKPETTKIDKTTKPAVVKETNANKIVFKVQIFASAKEVPLIAENFKGLNNISKESFNSLYRYLYGETQLFDYANRLKNDAISKGFKDAYLVAYKNGVRIDVKEALKYIKE
tara:strand:- start:72077 stop:73258 length:1182 start_codon:yes stop_codon:yes gene_type:complete